MEDNEEDGDGDNNFSDWAWVHEAGGFQDEPMDEDEVNVAQEEPPEELGQALLDAQKDSETVKEALSSRRCWRITKGRCSLVANWSRRSWVPR